MIITLVQAEIEAAIKQYVEDLVNVKEGMEVSIDLRAGRGVDGYTATIEIVKKGTAAPKTVIPEPKKVEIKIQEPEEKKEPPFETEEKAEPEKSEEDVEDMEPEKKEEAPRKSIFAGLKATE